MMRGYRVILRVPAISLKSTLDMSMLQPSFAFEMLHRASGRTRGCQHGIIVWIAQLSPEKLYWVLADKNEIVTVSETYGRWL